LTIPTVQSPPFFQRCLQLVASIGAVSEDVAQPGIEATRAAACGGFSQTGCR
jgi:hypothetical protein